jgi:hypothetical protein
MEVPPTKTPIEIQRICGPIQKISGDTWRVVFDRASFLGDRRGNEAWLAAVWPGDDDMSPSSPSSLILESKSGEGGGREGGEGHPTQFKRAVQQAMLPIPRRLAEGAPQKIDFPKIPNQKRRTKSLTLHATSDSGLPVGFFVREGPAEVQSDTLKFTAIPPRAKFPLKVTLGAYQFGRLAEPKIQSADPVFREFFIEQ